MLLWPTTPAVGSRDQSPPSKTGAPTLPGPGLPGRGPAFEGAQLVVDPSLPDGPGARPQSRLGICMSFLQLL
ncbi:unnamed protein product [Gulo gulo]|uniref:Uncharacterized protein n=1 Tax=Gulo gulo TaxID=48420 RepID=A0A9X9LYH8_GULGU|nr:unnamed protein product [Gulo gulo]